MPSDARAIAAALFLLTGCAGAQRSATGGGTLDRIKQSGVIRLGYRESSLPFSFKAPDGEPAGYSIDLCTRVAGAVRRQLAPLDLRVEWVPVTPSTRISSLLDGSIDLECGSTTNTLSRQEQVDFSSLTFVDGGSLLMRTGGQRTEALAGKRIAVIPGTTTERLVREMLASAHVVPHIVPVKEHDEGLAALDASRADMYASDRVILVGLVLRTPDPTQYGILEQYLSYEPYALMLRRGDAAFRLAINRELARIYRTNEILEIYGRWFGPLGPPTRLLLDMYALEGIPE